MQQKNRSDSDLVKVSGKCLHEFSAFYKSIQVIYVTAKIAKQCIGKA